MKIAKAVVAAVGTLTTVLTAALADDVLDVSETGSLVSALILGALSVYAVWRVPNRPAQ